MLQAQGSSDSGDGGSNSEGGSEEEAEAEMDDNANLDNQMEVGYVLCVSEPFPDNHYLGP